MSAPVADPVEVEITDPFTGEVRTFAGDTEADALKELDSFYGNDAANRASSCATLKELDRKREIRSELESVEHKLAQERKRLEKFAAVYASTPDGAAEAQRAYETEADEKEKEHLARVLLQGEELSREEFQKRVELGHSSDEDGAVLPIPLLADRTEVSYRLILGSLLGSYRESSSLSAEGKASVTLLKVGKDGSRSRLTSVAALSDPLSLESVLESMWSDPPMRPRLKRFLGESFGALDFLLKS